MLLLLLVVGSNTLVRASEPEAMLWALIQNHIKLLTQPMPPQVKVRSSCLSPGLGYEWHVCGSLLSSFKREPRLGFKLMYAACLMLVQLLKCLLLSFTLHCHCCCCRRLSTTGCPASAG